MALTGAPDPTVADTGEDLVFIDDRRLSTVYHEGLPCSDPSQTEYAFVVDMDVPRMLSERHVHGIMKFPLSKMLGWSFPNACLRSRETAARMVFRHDGAVFAEAILATQDLRMQVVELKKMSDPAADDLDAAIYDALHQGGDKWFGNAMHDDGFDPMPIIDDLASLLSGADAEDRAKIHFLMGRVLYLWDLVTIRQLRRSGGDVAAYRASVTNEDGERRDLALLREAAEQGHRGAALALYEASGLAGYLHAYKSKDAWAAPDDEAIRDLVRRYGFILDMADAHRIGTLQSEMNILAQRGFSIGKSGVFNDPNLPPGGRAIEDELNAMHGDVLSEADSLLSAAYDLPAGALYDCDGTWCKIGGGIVGRARINVKGLPDCDPPSDGRTTCRFAMALNVDSGGLLNQMPYNDDPVIAFMDKLLDEGSKATTQPEVEASFVRDGDRWRISDLRQ